MPAPLSVDLRRRVLDAARSATAPVVAARFGVSVSTVHRLRHLDRIQGSVEPRPHGGGHTPLVTDDDRPLFDGYLAENPSMPHATIARRFEADTGRAISRQTVQRMLGLWRVTRKKSP
ncbi:hypothetical protein RQM47_14220 [Rubrivirga sp. S365]|uniref:Transposase n=4 Tax=Rubrivirga TaxID=1434037 RepID=A0ABU3BVI7_9BACT|nr:MULTISPECIES: hypothetical protein [unclassified Rubrivirga]MDT0633315.1 hypothetical protein [Rubrivirga sp. F394]MDT7855333.1 hypothetical protein [Rubrivirga sp. S365]MDT7856739.1 hypothetical protein [Rubrivirga sp. S365]MDT7857014.1 hypothetical protein [Rubrivirga sp. S365]MDT7857084.1 hypothetical protein [Rubrivirga sp. S365]